jgi:hypothetical protein
MFMVGTKIFILSEPICIYNNFCTCRRIHSGIDLRQGTIFKTSSIDKENISLTQFDGRYVPMYLVHAKYLRECDWQRKT